MKYEELVGIPLAIRFKKLIHIIFNPSNASLVVLFKTRMYRYPPKLERKKLFKTII